MAVCARTVGEAIVLLRHRAYVRHGGRRGDPYEVGDLARRTGIDPELLGRWEKDRGREPSMTELRKISDVLADALDADRDHIWEDLTRLVVNPEELEDEADVLQEDNSPE